jgi:peptide subunit release factor 1 (eRF1)
VLRIELRASLDEIESKALPAIERLEADDARGAADRLIGAIGAQGLGAGRLEPTGRALEQGSVLELLLDADIGAGSPAEPEDEALSGLIGEADADELVRMASRTDARVTFVPEHAGLREMGGVGALLRYRA